MSSGWPLVGFESLYSEPSRNGIYKSKEFHGSGAKIINMGELFGYEFIGCQDMKRVQMTAEELSRSGVEDGDLLFGRRSLVEAGAGKCSIVRGLNDDTTFESSLIRVRLDRNKSLPLFYYYWFRSHVGRAGIKAIVTGTNVKGIKSSNLKKVRVLNPDLSVQHRIVEFIRCYDDLIENNRRRIELLEEAARQLYKEWFVRLRFPGHEHVKVENEVPEGWSRKKVGDYCTVGRGASPRPIKDFLDGDVPWFKIGDATASESPFIFHTAERVIEAGARKSVLLPEGELILSNSATCGIPNFTGVTGCIHDGWLYFKDLHVINKRFLYLYLVFRQPALLQGIGEGATQKNLNTTYVGRQELIAPETGPLLPAFEGFVAPIFDEIFVLSKQNNCLRRARDLLLPKFMSGEIAA